MSMLTISKRAFGTKYIYCICRYIAYAGIKGSHTPFWEWGQGPYNLGKIGGVLTKIGKFDIVLMYDVFIARLIPIIKLTPYNRLL